VNPVVLSVCSPVLIGDRGALEVHAAACRLSLQGLEIVERRQLGPGELRIGEIHAPHGRAVLDSAEAAVRGALAGEYQAVVAAPHTEAAIRAAGVAFDGYPTFVARVAGLPPEDGILMLCFAWKGRELRVAHVTLHAPVAEAVRLVTTERVLKTLRAVHHALRRIGIDRPAIAVGGLNPHALGEEEERLIAPAVAAVRKEGLAVDGPFGADTLLQRAQYDAHVVMLHDQGHVPAKLLAPNGAAALTIGTPVLFSSVAHGSALDIAGKGIADARAMVEAITRLVSHRRRASATSNT
jgi:4-hydroxy-L-threonine phosphate dehydrogenase PdxA